MKYILLLIFIVVTGISTYAKDIKDYVKVYGNCGSCKKRIEKAAKDAGAASANWSDKTQVLSLKYDDTKTSLLTIEKNVAAVGHDTRDIKATEEAYKKLEECCQYDRTAKAGTKKCADENEEKNN